MNTIKSRWENFETICLQGVSDQQRQEAHIAFYAGVMALLNIQDKVARKITSPEEAKVIVQAWQQELDIFKAGLAAEAMVKMAQARR